MLPNNPEVIEALLATVIAVLAADTEDANVGDVGATSNVKVPIVTPLSTTLTVSLPFLSATGNTVAPEIVMLPLLVVDSTVKPEVISEIRLPLTSLTYTDTNALAALAVLPAATVPVLLESNLVALVTTS